MRLLYFVAISLMALCSCSASGSRNNELLADAGSSDQKVLATAENKKYTLKGIFYGEEIGTGENEKIVAITQIILRDGTTGKEAKYAPIDESSIVSSRGFFTDVWSPDEELLVLPRGRFEGFCIVKSAKALESLSNKTCDDMIRIQATGGPAFWHDFGKWTKDGTFEFYAGLSGTRFKFQYDVASRKVHSFDKGQFEGENNLGSIKIN